MHNKFNIKTKHIFKDKSQKSSQLLKHCLPKTTLLMAIVVLLLTIFNLFIILQNINILKELQGEDKNTPQNDSSILYAAEKQTKNKTNVSLNDFSNNLAIIERGAKIQTFQNQLKIADKNCQTPISPPLVNGCWFYIAPNLLEIPENALLNNLKLTGNIPNSVKLVANIINFESKAEVKNLGIFSPQNNGISIPLPDKIEPFEVIQLNWQLGGNIELTISSLNISFMDNQSLVFVQGKSKLTNATGRIWLDKNQNGIIEAGIDRLWTCQDQFAGAKTVVFDNEGNFTIEADYSCQLDKTTLDSKSSLPFGPFLLEIAGQKQPVKIYLNNSHHSTETYFLTI